MSARPVLGDEVPLGQYPSGQFGPLAATAPTQGSGVLTSNNTNVTAGDTVTIGVPSIPTLQFKYTFVTALSASYTAGQVLKGTSADDSLTNLGYAVNNTANESGVKFYGRSANPLVSASAVSSHAVTFTANSSTPESSGGDGNSITTTTNNVGPTLTWGTATLTGGSAGQLLVSTGGAGESVFTPNTVAVANSGSSTIPVTATQWLVLFFGTGTGNTFGTITRISAPCSMSGTGKPATAIAIACDSSSTAAIIYSTT